MAVATGPLQFCWLALYSLVENGGAGGSTGESVLRPALYRQPQTSADWRYLKIFQVRTKQDSLPCIPSFLQHPNTMAAEFPLFSRLPAELRNQIWHDTLPANIGQLLYFYRKGCWCPRRLMEADEGYHTENDELNLNYEFRYQLLDPVRIDIPIFLVNREAHSIASAWIHGHGLKLRFHKDELIFVRPFDPSSDTLYVPLESYDDFFREPHDRQFEPDLLYKSVNCPGVAFERIAVPEPVIHNEGDPLPEFFEWYDRLKRLFIIVNAPSDLQPENTGADTRLQQRWELDETQGPAYYWNGSGFEWQDGVRVANDALYKRIEEVSNGIVDTLMENPKSRYEIRPAFAVRK